MSLQMLKSYIQLGRSPGKGPIVANYVPLGRVKVFTVNSKSLRLGVCFIS